MRPDRHRRARSGSQRFSALSTFFIPFFVFVLFLYVILEKGVCLNIGLWCVLHFVCIFLPFWFLSTSSLFLSFSKTEPYTSIYFHYQNHFYRNRHFPYVSLSSFVLGSLQSTQTYSPFFFLSRLFVCFQAKGRPQSWGTSSTFRENSICR